MITSLRLVDFKNFAEEVLCVGPFTVIVGANATGKSNIRDAFRFLHGVGRGYTLAEILRGRWGPGGQVEWQSVRGAPNEIGRVAVPPPVTFANTFILSILGFTQGGLIPHMVPTSVRQIKNRDSARSRSAPSDQPTLSCWIRNTAGFFSMERGTGRLGRAVCAPMRSRASGRCPCPR